MRAGAFAFFALLLISNAHANEHDPSLAFSLGGFYGDETSGIAVGVYSLRSDSVGWYINATVSSPVEEDDNFRPIPGDIRVDSDTDSITLNIGITLSIGRVVTYVGAGVSQVSEYALYRTASDAFWYEEKDHTKGNLNTGLLFGISQNISLDLGANSANDEITLGLNWAFK